jgi:hypothetical protein
MEFENVASEVRKFIADKIANGEQIVVEWLTNEIIRSKSSIDGEDVPFYRTCAFSHVKDVVRRSVGKYDQRSLTADRNQIVMDGFEHLQVAYTVSRNSDVVLVPVNQLTDAELLARAVEYDDMARGCRKHAFEIREYVRSRKEANAS